MDKFRIARAKSGAQTRDFVEGCLGMAMRHRLVAAAWLGAGFVALMPACCMASATGTLTPGGNLNFNTAAAGDPSPDVGNDVSGYTAGVTAIHLLSPSGWAYSSFFVYANATLADAQAASYNTDYVAGHGFIPSDYSSTGSVYYIRTGTGAGIEYFKMRTNGTNTATGLPLLWDYLGSVPTPPSSNFTFSSYDLITNFTDTSTGIPASWSWMFGDGGTSTQQSPRYRYNSAGSRSACLTASNSGGGGGNTCKTVSVSLVASTTVAQNTSIDLDNDGKGDLLVSSSGGCPTPNKLTQQNGARFDLIYKDYRSIGLADVNGASFTTSPGGFCVAVDYLEGFLVLSSFGAVYRAWTASNDAGSVRIEYGLLVAKERFFADGFE